MVPLQLVNLAKHTWLVNCGMHTFVLKGSPFQPCSLRLALTRNPATWVDPA